MNPDIVSPGRVLVTGALGFLGSEICRQLEVMAVEFRGLDRRGDPAAGLARSFAADIMEPATLGPALEGVQTVIHAAGLAHLFANSEKHSEALHAVNATGTRNVAEAAARSGVRHFILASSVSVYGSTTKECDESAACAPRTAYGKSKLEAEHHAIGVAERAGMGLTILRLATLYGEGDPGNVGRLMRAIDRRRFCWIGDGSNRKSLLYRGDAARACVYLSQKLAQGATIYNISGTTCTMRDIVDNLATELERTVPRWGIPGSLARRAAELADRILGQQAGLSSTIDKWLRDDAYSGEKFRRRAGFDSFMELREGLRREVTWYRTHRPA